jgi:copper transport protein
MRRFGRMRGVCARVLRAAASAGACALLLASVPGRAAAHAHLRSSSPAAGATLDAGVREVRLRFSEVVEPAFTSVTLTGPDGGVLSAPPLGFPPDGGGREAVLTLAQPLTPGRWTVAWRAAAADGHVSRGSFAFTVAEAENASAAAAKADTLDPPPVGASFPDHGLTTAVGLSRMQPEPEAMHRDSALDVAFRWVGLLALVLMVGTAAFHVGVASPAAPAIPAVAADADRRAARLGLGAAVLSVPPLVFRLGTEAAALEDTRATFAFGGAASVLVRTGWGHAWLIQAGATLLLAAGLLLAGRGRRGGWMLACAAAAALALAPALSGHAAASAWPAVGIAVDWAHVLGASAWLGTLACVILAGVPAAFADREGAGTAVAELANRFSPVALAGASVAGLSGVAAACLRLEAPSQLWSTGYGQALLFKLALLAVVALIGLYNWRVVRPALGGEAGALRLRRSGRAELAFAALVLLATAVLVGTPPP